MARINVLALRRKLKLTQAALAEKVGVEQSTIHRWEKGERTPRGPALAILKQIANA